LYSRGANLPVEYRRELSARIKSACADAGLGTDGGQALPGASNPVRGVPGDRDASFPRGSLPASGCGDQPVQGSEPSLF